MADKSILFSIGRGAHSTKAILYQAENFADFADIVVTGAVDELPDGLPQRPKTDDEKLKLPWFAAPFKDGKRNGKNVLPWSVLVLDIDRCVLDVVEPLLVFLRGLAPIFGYSTSSYTDDAPRFRVLLSLDRAVKSTEAQYLARAIQHKLEGIGLANQVALDPAQQRPGQIAFLPCLGSVVIDLKNADVPALCVDEWLQSEIDTPGVGDSQADLQPERLETSGAVEEVRSALSTISADCSYDRWLAVLLSLRSTGWQAAEDLARDWSASAPHRYNQIEFIKVWADGRERTDGAKRTLSTVFQYAKENGWKPVKLPLGNDQQNALAFLAECPGRHLWSPQRDAWVSWDGKRWRVDPEGVAIRANFASFASLCLIAAEAALRGAPDSKLLAKHCITARSLGMKTRRDAALVFIRETVVVPEEINSARIGDTPFDQNGMQLGTPSGTVNISALGWTLRPSSEADMITKTTSVTPKQYSPALWLQTLERAFDGDADKLRWFHVWVGACCIGKPQTEIAVFVGAGRDGKSLIARVLTAVFHDYAGDVSPSALCLSRFGGGDGPQASLFKAIGMRYVTVQETGSLHHLDSEMLKRITGGDPMSVRTLFSKPVTAQMVCGLLMYGNSLPAVAGQQQDSLRRRLYAVRFPKSVSEKEDDAALYDKLVAEGPAILAWALDGAVMYEQQHRGKAMPSCSDIEETTSGWLSTVDPTEAWLRDCTRPARPSEAGSTPTELLDSCRAYRHMLDDQSRVTAQALGRWLAGKGVVQSNSRANGRRYPVMLIDQGDLVHDF